MTETEILLEARRRAGLRAWKRPAIQEKILLGKWDDKASVLKARRQVEQEVNLAKLYDMKPLRQEEDEPCFSELMQRAKARAVELKGTPDAALIAELIAAYEHADTAADMIYWNASDNQQLPYDG